MLALWYHNTAGHFAFYINATSTPQQKNGIRTHSRALAGIRRHSRAIDPAKMPVGSISSTYLIQ
jgi:hypothetical protein